MSRKYIIEDSSFVVSLMSSADPLHSDAYTIFKYLLTKQDNIKTVIPTTAFYESLYVLIKSGINVRIAKTKLNYLMMIDDVINYCLTESAILKMAKDAETLIRSVPQKTNIRSHDLMLLTIAMNYENSCFLTSDRGMKDYQSVYKNIFCFNDQKDVDKMIKFIDT